MYQKPRYGERFGPLPTSGIIMLLCDFQSKLKRLNEDLYVKTDERVKHANDFWLSGIYLKATRQTIRGDKNYAGDTAQRKYLEELENGNLDKYICGVCLNHIPEYDIFDFELTRLLASGWRKIVLRLVKMNLCTLAEARKVFNCSALGESTYDKMKFFDRFNWAKKITQGETNA